MIFQRIRHIRDEIFKWLISIILRIIRFNLNFGRKNCHHNVHLKFQNLKKITQIK